MKQNYVCTSNYNVILACFINLGKQNFTQNSYKKHKKFMNSNWPKSQLISKCPFGVIVWTKIATKKFDNFCPGGQIKKQTLYYIKYPIINVKK